MIKDKFERLIDYVRIGVTDRCNLRCFYCMPDQGMVYEPKAHLLTFEEIERLLRILGKLGFSKVRFTGGEPFVRRNFMDLLERTAQLGLYKEIRVTTNGTLISAHIGRLRELGITHLNISIDSFDPVRYSKITRRDDYDVVLNTIYKLVEEGFKIKLNAVIMHGVNTKDIIPLARFAERHPANIRFIEEMPFNGGYKPNDQIFSAREILDTLKSEFPNLKKLEGRHGDTATNYQVPGFFGNISVIPAFSRNFCNICNRLRITAVGDVKTCLYDSGVYSIRDLLRSGADDTEVAQKLIELIRLKPENGFVAENKKSHESMSTIGG